MRRRRSADPNDALDLFLDAISNVFGGLLFLAMLVILLLQMTPQTPAPGQSSAASAELQRQVQALEVQAVATNGDRETALSTLLDRQAALHAAIRATVAEIDAVLQQASDRRDRLATLERETAEAEAAVRAAKASFEEARAQRAGLVRLPQFRPTDKAEFPLLIAGGRVVPLFRLGTSGEAWELNREMIELVEDGRRVRPKPAAGTAVTPQDAAAVARELVRGLSSERHFIALAVWDNAFSEAVALRDALAAAGFEYGLVLLTAEQTVATGAEGGVQ